MKTTCFGEYLLRLSPEGAYRFCQAARFDAVYGGAEANTAAALSYFGEDAAFVSKLPSNAIGDAALEALRRTGMDCSGIIRGDGRMGIYFLEKGSGIRPSKVIYDREYSAFSRSLPHEYDWKSILQSSDSFFFTGITAALSSDMPSILRQAIDACKSLGVGVFCDINYRSALWTVQKAAPVMRRLISGIDTLIANEEHASLLLDVSCTGEDDDVRYGMICRTLCERYGISRVVLTKRTSISADDNTVGAFIYDAQTGESAASHSCDIHIADRVGGGDALSAAVIYARHCGFDLKDTIEFASAANAFKHSVNGDTLAASAQEIMDAARTICGDGCVRMIR